MFRFFLNLLLPIAAFLAAPFWLLKTSRRGGLSRRLWEKLALYDEESPPASGPDERPIYLHAVSVGEVNIARKLIEAWAEAHPGETFLLAVGTSTGFDLARRSEPPRTGILYAPLDFPLALRAMLKRYRPSRIVLIEAEVWPNLMAIAHAHSIPVALANARLSPRSGRRLAKVRPLMGPSYHLLDWVGAQTADDVARLAAVGVREQAITVVGSVKFDPALATPASSDFDPAPLLDSLGEGPVLMALSTHEGEELVFAKAASALPQARIVIVPRHMERRDAIVESLREAGLSVQLRSTNHLVDEESLLGKILVVDSTGELPAFTAHAQVAFIGKTLLASGGQNPCEAIAAGVPIVAGPHLENFEPLASELRSAQGLQTIETEAELTTALQSLLEDADLASQQARNALTCLESHRGATARTVAALSEPSVVTTGS